MKQILIILAVILIGLILIKQKNMNWRQSFLKTVYPLIMLKANWLPDKRSAQLNKQKIPPAVSFYTLQAIANNGAVIDFSSFRGKKVLIVNTASDCGYTAQYAQLETLHQQYKHKLVIIGFPANDFKQQEQKDDAAIAAFCKANFGVTFLLMKKTQVIKGAAQNPVFQWLTQPDKNGWCNRQPIWNFNKYLINENGILTGFFAHTISPLAIADLKTVNP